MWLSRRKLEALESRLRLLEEAVQGLGQVDFSRALNEATEANATGALLLDRLQAMNARLVKRIKDAQKAELPPNLGPEQPAEGPEAPVNGPNKRELYRYAREKGMIR